MVYRAETKVTHTVLLHNAQELDNDLAARPDHDLALSRLLGVVDGVERIVKDGCACHIDGCGGVMKSRKKENFWRGLKREILKAVCRNGLRYL